MSIIVQEMGLSNTHYGMESNGVTPPDFDLMQASLVMDAEDQSLATAMEAAVGLESLTHVEGVPGPVLLVAAENMLAHMGYHESLNLPSMESEADTTHGMESIVQTIKNIWKAIWNGIKRAAAKVRDWFKKLFGVAEKVEESVATTKKVLKGVDAGDISFDDLAFIPKTGGLGMNDRLKASHRAEEVLRAKALRRYEREDAEEKRVADKQAKDDADKVKAEELAAKKERSAQRKAVLKEEHDFAIYIKDARYVFLKPFGDIDPASAVGSLRSHIDLINTIEGSDMFNNILTDTDKVANGFVNGTDRDLAKLKILSASSSQVFKDVLYMRDVKDDALPDGMEGTERTVSTGFLGNGVFVLHSSVKFTVESKLEWVSLPKDTSMPTKVRPLHPREAKLIVDMLDNVKLSKTLLGFDTRFDDSLKTLSKSMGKFTKMSDEMDGGDKKTGLFIRRTIKNYAFMNSAFKLMTTKISSEYLKVCKEVHSYASQSIMARVGMAGWGSDS